MPDSKKRLLGIVGAVLLSVPVLGQENGEKTFASPSDASTALYDAVKAGDKTAMEAVLGPSSQPLLSSGERSKTKRTKSSFYSTTSR